MTLLFFAPFFVIGIREILTLGQYVPKLDSSTINRVAAVLVIGYFLLNVGFISATVTHEYSTNALVEKDRIMDEGHPVETTYFYKQYPTVQGVAGTSFLFANAASNTTRYTNGWPGIPRGAVGYTEYNEEPPDRPHFNRVRMTRDMLNESGGLGPGYLYMNTYTDERWGNTIRYPTGHFGFQCPRTSDVDENWAEKNRVYDNGASAIYKQRLRRSPRPRPERSPADTAPRHPDTAGSERFAHPSSRTRKTPPPPTFHWPRASPRAT